MDSREENVGVALVNYACPICGKVDEDASAVLINRVFTKKYADEVRGLNNRTVGYSDRPCKACQGYIDDGAFFVIGVDGEKTDDMSNPWRSGHLVGIKKDSDFYRGLPDEYKRRDAVFMDYRQMRMIGLLRDAGE